MSDPSKDIDPYYKWLGIPKNQQPPSMYRLLGIENFESNPEVISAAASRQVAYLHQLSSGPQREQIQRLLNEIAKARITLIDAESRQQYDQELRARLESQQPPSTPSQPITDAVLPKIDLGYSVPEPISSPIFVTTDEPSQTKSIQVEKPKPPEAQQPAKKRLPEKINFALSENHKNSNDTSAEPGARTTELPEIQIDTSGKQPFRGATETGAAETEAKMPVKTSGRSLRKSKGRATKQTEPKSDSSSQRRGGLKSPIGLTKQAAERPTKAAADANPFAFLAESPASKDSSNPIARDSESKSVSKGHAGSNAPLDIEPLDIDLSPTKPSKPNHRPTARHSLPSDDERSGGTAASGESESASQADRNAATNQGDVNPFEFLAAEDKEKVGAIPVIKGTGEDQPVAAASVRLESSEATVMKAGIVEQRERPGSGGLHANDWRIHVLISLITLIAVIVLLLLRGG